MSLLAMNLVWQNYRVGGSAKLALLALADWCDDAGENLYPSIATIAKKICVTECQARRIIHSFIDDGLLEVIGNHNGGAKGQSRRYRLNLQKLAVTPSTDATPSASATPSMDARHPSHPCALPLAPMLVNPSLTVKEPSVMSASAKDAAEILTYLNKKTNRNYKPVEANIRLIAARLSGEATLDECRAVIDAKVAEWSSDRNWSKYLRPATLFNATKFAQYVGDLGSKSTHAGGVQWE